MMTGPSTLSALVAAQEASMRISSLASSLTLVRESAAFRSPSLGVLASMQMLEMPQLTALAGTIEALTRGFGEAARPLLVERGVSVAIRGWDEATRTLEPDALRIAQVSGVGRGALGAARCGLLLTEQDDEPEELELLGRGEFSANLRLLLADLGADLPARLDGAWERVSRPGPDAASQAAHSVMELVDHTLRRVAPDDLVLRWVEQEDRSRELHIGSPTRILRMKYALRHRSADTTIMRLQSRALGDLVSAVQGMKHGPGPQDLLAVQSLIPIAEGLLFFILSGRQTTASS